MDHIKGWMASKTHEDSMEGITTALNQLFEIRQNHFFNSSAPSESFINEFKVFQADSDLQHCLASASSFLTGVKIGMVDMDGMFNLATQRLKYLFCGGSTNVLSQKPLALPKMTHLTSCPLWSSFGDTWRTWPVTAQAIVRGVGVRH